MKVKVSNVLFWLTFQKQSVYPKKNKNGVLALNLKETNTIQNRTKNKMHCHITELFNLSQFKHV